MTTRLRKSTLVPDTRLCTSHHKVCINKSLTKKIDFTVPVLAKEIYALWTGYDHTSENYFTLVPDTYVCTSHHEVSIYKFLAKTINFAVPSLG